jgi:hypothetical protein
MVAADGTGIHRYACEPWPDCPYRTGKKDKKTWPVNVLEAKSVCSNDFSIYMGTEWIKTKEKWRNGIVSEKPLSV